MPSRCLGNRLRVRNGPPPRPVRGLAVFPLNPRAGLPSISRPSTGHIFALTLNEFPPRCPTIPGTSVPGACPGAPSLGQRDFSLSLRPSPFLSPPSTKKVHPETSYHKTKAYFRQRTPLYRYFEMWIRAYDSVASGTRFPCVLRATGNIGPTSGPRGLIGVGTPIRPRAGRCPERDRWPVNSMPGPVHGPAEARLPHNPPHVHPLDVKKKLNCDWLAFAAISLRRQKGSDAFRRLRKGSLLSCERSVDRRLPQAGPKRLRGPQKSLVFFSGKNAGEQEGE